MNDKKLIAKTLLEIAKNSTTELIENSNIDKEIIDAAKKMGLILPSPDFAVFKTKWADIDKHNLNLIRLPKKAVEDGIQTLVGKNLNFEHKGAYNVCGFCLSVKIKGKEIECIQVFYKSLYPDEFEELKEKIKTKEAAVSFEIWNRDPDTGKSVVKDLEDGTKEITKIICHGTGLLLVNPPACPTAKIFKLVAKNLTEVSKTVTHRVFEEDLIYAQLAIGNNEKEDSIVEETKKDETVEEIKTEVQTEETKPVETGAETKPVETNVEEAAKTEEVKEPEKIVEKSEEITEKAPEKAVEKEEAQPLEQIEPKIVIKTTSIYSEVRVETYVDGTPSGTSEIKGYNKKITEYKDGTKDEVEEEVDIKKKYDFAELETKVAEAKAEKDIEIKSLTEIKDKEVSDLKTVNEELDKEVKKLKEELEQKSQEIAKLTVKEEPKKDMDLAVGAVEVKNRYKNIQDEVNRKAFPPIK